MAEPGKTERWNSLLETLGVPVSEPAKEQVTPQPPTGSAPSKPQPVSMLPPKKQKEAPKPQAGPPAAKSPSYWSRIAGALGLDVGQAPPPAAEEPKPQRIEEPKTDFEEPPRRVHEPVGREREMPPRAFQRPARGEDRPSRQRPAREERPAREARPSREERARHEERPEKGDPSARPPNEMFGGRPSDVDVFSLAGDEGPRMREPSSRQQDERQKEERQKEERGEQERGSVLDYDVPDASGSDLALGRTTASQEDIRAESRGEEGQGREGGRRRRRRGRGRRGRGEFREGGPPQQQHEADIEPAGEEADFDLDRDEPLELEPEIGGQRSAPGDEVEGGPWLARDEQAERYPPAGERQPRDRADERGGRGRRGRGRGRDRDRPAGERPAHYRSEEPQRARPPRDAMADGNREDEEIDEDLTAEMEEIDDERGGDVPTHKKIPTWDEAVNILIDANMANRGPDRDRGYGRGRGRR